MCLILFAIKPNHRHQLIVAANRDEQHVRPSLSANYWQEVPHILGGRDLESGGTWLGVSRYGRFAAVTNFAATPAHPLLPRSRGELPVNFLQTELDCKTYLHTVDANRDAYRGFNLLVWDGKLAYYYSSLDSEIRQLASGFYGLSNQRLNCHWPKVNTGRQQLTQLAEGDFPTQALFNLLTEQGNHEPHTAKFILGEHYGTRASTIVKFTQNSIFFSERSYNSSGQATGSVNFEIS